MKLPDVVSPADWQRSNDEQVEKEKQAMRARDAVSAARRRLPMVAFNDDYEFEGPDGKASLLDLFEGRTQLILYSFYFTPGDEEPCSGCSMFTDNLGHPDGLKHLHDRDATFATISLATQEQIEPMKKRLGWRHPWYTDSNREYSTRSNTLESFRLSVFLRDGADVYRTYTTQGRGVEALSGAAMTDLLPLGRQEAWEDSPDGWPQQPPYTWGALHDSYGPEPTAPSFGKPLEALPRLVCEEEWDSNREKLLVEEKQATRERDALAAERRRRPMERIEKAYRFDGPNGTASLLDLFDGRRQLILYHFMLEPGSEDPCPGCSMFTDSVGHLAHLNQRDTTMSWVSLAPRDEIERVRERMGWDIPWYSSAGSDFNADFGRTTPNGEMFGLSVFVREGDDIYRSYFTSNRGVDGVGSTWTLLDLTPLGRQEDWEDSPEDYPQTPRYEWWQLHDDYEPEPAASR